MDKRGRPFLHACITFHLSPMFLLPSFYFALSLFTHFSSHFSFPCSLSSLASVTVTSSPFHFFVRFLLKTTCTWKKKTRTCNECVIIAKISHPKYIFKESMGIEDPLYRFHIQVSALRSCQYRMQKGTSGT